MELTLDYECMPQGARPVYTGGAKEDDGGRWVPVVFEVGENKFQSGVLNSEPESDVVLHRAIMEEFDFACRVANELARIASA